MKNKALYLLFIQIIINGCSKPSPPNAVINLPYVISVEDSLLKIKYEKEIPPPYGFYGSLNLIVDDSDKLFVHFKQSFHMEMGRNIPNQIF
jgi:hypothetical protein